MTSGAANFNGNGINIITGLSWSESGGALTSGGGLNVEASTYTQSGGSATYTGPITVSGGNYTLSSGTSSSMAYLSVTSGTYAQTGGSGSFAQNLSVQGGSYTQSSGTVQFAQGGQVSSGIWKQSGGTLTLSGNLIVDNTYTGDGNVTPYVLVASGTYNQTGGIVNVGNEADFNNANGSMSGGVLNINSLFTMVNGKPGFGATFNFSGGVINDDINGTGANNGFYGANSTNPFNFTLASSGTLNFFNNNLAAVTDWVNGGEITYQDTTDPGAFTIDQSGNEVSVFLTIPEPSTYALLGIGIVGMMFFLRRKKAGLTV